MSAYVIGHITVNDAEGYARYSARVPDTLAPFGGEFVVRGGETTLLEGAMPHLRHVTIRFPDHSSAEGWYNSPAYQEIVPIRQANADGTLILVEGYAA